MHPGTGTGSMNSPTPSTGKHSITLEYANNIQARRLKISSQWVVSCFVRPHISNERGPLFVIREFDVKIIRNKFVGIAQPSNNNTNGSSSDDDDKKHHASTSSATFLTEQAIRASVRQAVLNMSLKLESASKHEIQYLKHIHILGKRAPSCSLLDGYDMSLLLEAFGRTYAANELKKAVYALKQNNSESLYLPPLLNPEHLTEDDQLVNGNTTSGTGGGSGNDDIDTPSTSDDGAAAAEVTMDMDIDNSDNNDNGSNNITHAHTSGTSSILPAIKRQVVKRHKLMRSSMNNDTTGASNENDSDNIMSPNHMDTTSYKGSKQPRSSKGKGRKRAESDSFVENVKSKSNKSTQMRKRRAQAPKGGEVDESISSSLALQRSNSSSSSDTTGSSNRLDALVSVLRSPSNESNDCDDDAHRKAPFSTTASTDSDTGSSASPSPSVSPSPTSIPSLSTSSSSYSYASHPSTSPSSSASGNRLMQFPGIANLYQNYHNMNSLNGGVNPFTLPLHRTLSNNSGASGSLSSSSSLFYSSSLNPSPLTPFTSTLNTTSPYFLHNNSTLSIRQQFINKTSPPTVSAGFNDDRFSFTPSASAPLQATQQRFVHLPCSSSPSYSPLPITRNVSGVMNA